MRNNTFRLFNIKSCPKYKIDRDIADNADKNRKTSKKHTEYIMYHTVHETHRLKIMSFTYTIFS